MRASRTRRYPRHRQRGAALLTAMIIVTLVATLAAAMVWQQWRAVQVEAAERARVQSTWILSGALDFAKLILREDMKSAKQITALTEPWATPLAEARLSTFLAADKANTDDGPEAFLSGNINDAQARYNLTNLVGTGDKALAERKVMERLCQNLNLDVGLAARIANGLTAATAATSAAAPLLPRTVAQLTWLGIDQASLQALQPYVVLLPAASKVNINTASKEVLMAVIQGLDAGSAARLIQIRQRTPFETLAGFKAEIKALEPVADNIDVRSDYFEVTGRLRLSDRVLTERSLVQRIPLPNRQINVLQRERIASLEQVGS